MKLLVKQFSLIFLLTALTLTSSCSTGKSDKVGKSKGLGEESTKASVAITTPTSRDETKPLATNTTAVSKTNKTEATNVNSSTTATSGSASKQADERDKPPIEPKYIEWQDGSIPGSKRSGWVVQRFSWVKSEDYKGVDGTTYSLADIVLPKFLFETKDARAANIEIDRIENRIVSEFEEAKSSKNLFGQKTTYSVYSDDQMISVLVQHDDDANDVRKCYTFNFDRYGHRLTNKALTDLFKVTEKISDLAEEAIVREEENLLQSDYQKTRWGINVFNTALSSNLEMFREESKKGEMKLYVNELRQLSLAYHIISPFLHDISMRTVRLAANLPTNYGSNPLYSRVANYFNDPNANRFEGYVIHLGDAWNKETLQKVLAAEWAFSEKYSPNLRPGFLAITDENGRIEAQEYYLLIPRRSPTVITLEKLRLTDKGELELVDYSERSAVDYVIIAVNRSELHPNAKVSFRTNSTRFSFSPAISLKDGGMVLPKELVDVNVLIEKYLPETARFDEDLLEQILDMN